MIDMLEEVEARAAMVDADPSIPQKTRALDMNGNKQDFLDIPPKEDRLGPYLTFTPLEQLLYYNADRGDKKEPIFIARVSYSKISEQENYHPVEFMDDVEAANRFAQAVKTWKNTKHDQAIREFFSMPGVHIQHKTTKLVAFGLGEFCVKPRPSDDLGGYQRCYDSIRTQHAVFQEVGRSLQAYLDQTSPGDEITLVAQDPGYSALDKRILKDMDVRAIDHPVRGIMELDNESAVFSIGAGFPVKQVVFAVSRPTMIIWQKPSKRGLAHPAKRRWLFPRKAEDQYEPQSPSP
jgi:hypothetical protein